MRMKYFYVVFVRQAFTDGDISHQGKYVACPRELDICSLLQKYPGENVLISYARQISKKQYERLKALGETGATTEGYSDDR